MTDDTEREPYPIPSREEDNSDEIMTQGEFVRRLRGMFAGGVIVGILACAVIAAAGLLVYRVILDRELAQQQEEEEVQAEPEYESDILTDEARRKLHLLEETIDLFYYKNDIDEEEARVGMYKGLVESLNDPYSVYYTDEEYKEMMTDTEGIYSGIGAYVSMDKELKYPRISSVIENSPAQDAKLEADDIIYEVDGQSVYGMELSAVVKLIKGEEGTTVNLTIIRDEEGELSVDLVRRQVETPTVSTEMLDNGIGYLKLSAFDMVSSTQFEEGMARLRKEGMRALVLDLRSNPGGSLSVVCNIARQILPEGLIVYTLDRDGNRQEYTCDGTNEIDIPLVVLINGYSASASEILSGAVKDYGIGTLIGTTTYGKGVVQRVFDFTDNTAVKLTISNYFTPAGNDINGVGIEPDIEVPFDSDAYKEDGTDNQLDRAVEELLKQLGD